MAKLNTVKVAFEPFAKIEPGKPIKLMPIGTFYRGKRVLDITKDRLQEIVKNFQIGLPRFRVGFNIEHTENDGKVGDVKSLAVLDDGLYATEYDLTSRGLEAIEAKGFDATSAEVIWSLNHGAKFQDPESGNEYDNVLTGVAFTTKPFFGHNHVALFTADAEKADEVIAEEKMTITELAQALVEALKSLVAGDEFREFTSEQRQQLAKEGKALPDGSYPIVNKQDLRNAIQAYGRGGSKAQVKAHIIKRAKALGASDMLPEEWSADIEVEELEINEEVEPMTEEVEKIKEVVEEPAEEMAVNADVERLAAELAAANEKSEKLAAELDGMKEGQRRERIHDIAEGFKALPLEVDEFTDKMIALEDAAPEVATWVMEKFAALDVALVEAGLMREIGTERDADLSKVDKFLQLIESNVKEGQSYAEAMKTVIEAEPELAKAYVS